MSKTRLGLRPGTLCLIAMLALPQLAQAQGPAPESQRQAVFAQLLSAPDDRALMLQYARLSVQMRDFEAAAATLERFVDLDPDNAGARVELAIAYFALGAYDVAGYHLAAAGASGALTPEQAGQVADYRDEIAARDRESRFTGRIALGQARTVQAGENGTFGNLALRWRLDMGGANANDWVTELSYNSHVAGERSFNDLQTGRLRSGPEFRLTGDAYGPRLQPYVEMSRVREDSAFTGFSGDYDAVAFGLAYQNPHNAFLTSYADIQLGTATSRETFGTDFDFRELALGVGYRPSRDTRLRTTIGWRHEDYGGRTETRRHLRLEGLHSFRVGGDSSAFFPRRWELRAHGQRAMIEREFGFGFVEEITETTWGGGLRAFVADDVFVEARGSRFESENRFGTVRDETVYALQIGWEF